MPNPLPLFRRFLFAPVAPLNLAVLRVALFGAILFLLVTEPIREVAAWSRTDLEWPAIAGPILSRLPIDVEIVDWLMPIAIVTTVMAIIGCFTRTACWTSCLLAIYLLGISQCTGQANHAIHHVILIGLVLACSRAGDALSLDAMWRALRRADYGKVARLPRSIRYGLPLRLSMLIFATCYFFPGIWTFASTPAKSSALAAIFFAIGFPIALLWQPTRGLWALLGLVLHNSPVGWIKFNSVTMQIMYVMFVDWQRLLAWLGKKMFGGPLVVLFDGNCKLCRRTMAVLMTLDWLHLLKPISAFKREKFEKLGLGHLDDLALATDLHCGWRVAGGKWRVEKGYAAYQQIAWRVPLLWPTLLITYLPPVAAFGTRIYRRVADSRGCTPPIDPDQA